MVIVTRTRFPSFHGTETRRLYVYLPRQYEEQRRRRFPVLYMFDGHNVFFDSDATYGKSWGVGEYLDRHNVPLIVVAPECDHGPNGERIQEYSPYDFLSEGDWASPGEADDLIPGYGRDTLDWFTQVLKPRIDRKYRTLSGRNHTFLMGSSMGGLMGVFAAMEYNRVFGKVCAMSPALECWTDAVLENAETCEVMPDTSLYMDYGMLEETYEDAAPVLLDMAAMYLEKGMDVTLRFIPQGHHCEASWEKQLPFAINFLMYKPGD